MINETNQLLRLIARALITIAESRDASCVDNDAVARLRRDLAAIGESQSQPPFAPGHPAAQHPAQGFGGLAGAPPASNAPTAAKTGMAHGL